MTADSEKHSKPLTEAETRELVLRKMREGLPRVIESLRDLARNAEDPAVRRDAKKSLEEYGIPLDPPSEESESD